MVSSGSSSTRASRMPGDTNTPALRPMPVSEFGSLTCAVGKVVWITERTSAGTTSVSWNVGTHKLLKRQWSTSKDRTGQRTNWWRVTTTGQMDHRVTGAPASNRRCDLQDRRLRLQVRILSLPHHR
jgi:hypothetical protein